MFLDVTFFKKIGLLIVSGKPPLLEIITAFAREPASKEDLPKGSSLKMVQQLLRICHKVQNFVLRNPPCII